MIRKATLYARVSGDDTRREGRNLASQLEMCRAYCEDRDYRIVAELAEDDRGASGASWDLPQLNKALDMARAGEFDVLVTRELDRFARGLAKQLVIEGEFKRHGVEIEYVLAEYEDSPEGQLSKNIRAVIAEYEREKINQRMTRGRRNIVKGGKVMLHGQAPPYGYRVQDREFVIYEPEAKIVRLIYTWYVYGDETHLNFSIKAIARQLTEMRVPTHVDVHGGGYKKRGHGEWSPGTVSDVLSNETYAGVWHYGKRDKDSHTNPRKAWLTVEVPSIVSREVWERAQWRKGRNKALASRNSKYEYLLGRRVSCGQCNEFKMYGKAVQGGKYKYYACPGVRHGACDQGYFRVDQVDGAVWDWVKGLLLDPEHLRRELEEQRDRLRQDIRPLYERVKVIDDLLAANQRKLAKLVDDYLEQDDFLRETLIEKKNHLRALMANLEQERVVLTAYAHQKILTDTQIKSIEDMARKMGEKLGAAEADFASRRQMIEALDVRATLAIEGEQKVANVSCTIREEEALAIVNASTRNAWPET